MNFLKRRDNSKVSLLMSLIKNNTGVSSKNFFLVMVTLVGILLLLIVAFVLIWEVIQNGTIQTDMQGLAMFVGSITSLFTAAGLTKALGEKNEHHDNNNDELDA